MNEQEKKSQTFHRYLDGLYTKAEAQEVFDHIEQYTPDENQDFPDSELWEEAASQFPASEAEIERYRDEARQLLAQLKHPSRKRFGFHPLLRIAAIICIVFAGIIGWNYWINSHVTYLTVTTVAREQKELTLPDGTQLTLNACSRIDYPEHFTGKSRTVTLEGEAFFDVSPDKKHPFRIQTKQMNITVLGTRFNAKSYSSDELISVEVESGKVEVELPDATLRLKANEQIVYNTIAGEIRKQCDTIQAGSWRKGSLYFNNTPLYDVAKNLERIYGCHITFADGQKFNNLISGEHDNESLESVLQSIEYTTGIHIRKTDDSILFYKD